MVKDYSDSERGNAVSPHGLLSEEQEGFFLYSLSHIQNSTYHGLCYTSGRSLVGTRKKLNGSNMKDRSDNTSHHERTLLPWSYILARFRFYYPSSRRIKPKG